MAAVGGKAGIHISARFDTAEESAVASGKDASWQSEGMRNRRGFHHQRRLCAIAQTAAILSNLFGAGAYVTRGEKKQIVAVRRGDALATLSEVERGISKQRYKGLVK